MIYERSFVVHLVSLEFARYHTYKDMLNNLDLMHIEKNDQIIFDDVVRISGEFIVGLLTFCDYLTLEFDWFTI